MDIKVGEYVRTHVGTIKKIIKIDKHLVMVGHGMQDWHYYCKTDKGNKLFAETLEELQMQLKKAIKTHSFDILDLIEVGDYVNGYKVLDFKKKEDRIMICIARIGISERWLTFYRNEILDILTGAEFLRRTYFVEENKCTKSEI